MSPNCTAKQKAVQSKNAKKLNKNDALGGCEVARQAIPNEVNEPRLSDFRIRQHADWYLKRVEPERQKTGGMRRTELDAALRKVLAEDGVLAEFIAVEFERVMAAVFGS